MARTHPKHTRAYINGVDVSGYSRSIGPLAWTFDATPDATWTDAVKNVTIGQCTINGGVLNAVLDNDAAGLFVLANAGTGTRYVMATIGVNAAPVAGDPMFAWTFEQTSYTMETGEGFVSANVPIGDASYASNLTYRKPWGYLVHASGAETAVNTAIGLDDNSASSALGGIFVYHLLSSNGTCTLSMDDASTNTNPSFAALSGATSGSITAAVSPKYGMISLSATATVRRYTRWQIAFGTATTATFALGFIRNNL